VNFVEFSTPLL